MILLSDYIRENYNKSFKDDDYSFELVSKKVKKGTIIYPYHRIGKNIYFLNSGIVETTISFGEIEKTLSFIFEGNFFCAFASLLTQSPSEIQGTALTDCEFQVIPYVEYKKLCESVLLVNQIGRQEVENYYLNKYLRERDLLTKTKEEMYLDLLKTNPHIVKNIPLKKIANYFGILPETLSRIRKKIK
ncbi:MAG: Crp/Fnr family transcriptional regulator [Flavobacteriales bacterium]|jgi:CRP-like cAMP-binding protein|nr:Crp/Fnr family transcriptional regulator [Flavobacteriales bacterium]